MEEKNLNPIDENIEENDNVILYDEDGEATEFEHVANIPLDDKNYVILVPVTPIEGVGEDEGFVFLVEEDEDGEFLTLVDDDELVDKIFDIYNSLPEEDEE